jgi:cytochrome c-type biogenesis protein CcmE
MLVAYHGIIPDTFVDDAAVVVEGQLQDDGTFRAHTLLAKCPSKYEAAEVEGATGYLVGTDDSAP